MLIIDESTRCYDPSSFLLARFCLNIISRRSRSHGYLSFSGVFSSCFQQLEFVKSQLYLYLKKKLISNIYLIDVIQNNDRSIFFQSPASFQTS